jgi:hypothetical protein
MHGTRELTAKPKTTFFCNTCESAAICFFDQLGGVHWARKAMAHPCTTLLGSASF